MRLSYYSDYALRVLMSAALCEPQITTIDSVARSFNISRNHLVKIVHMLGLKRLPCNPPRHRRWL